VAFRPVEHLYFQQVIDQESGNPLGSFGMGLAQYFRVQRSASANRRSSEMSNCFMKRSLRYLGLAMAGMILLAGVASADQIFTTATGAINPLTGTPVSGTADFNLTGTTLTLTLSNTITGIGSAGQLLTGLTFTLSDGSGVSLSSQTGDLVQVNSDKTFTDLGTGALGWGFGSPGTNTFEVCMICTGGVSSGVTPAEGILGPVSGDGKYDSANNSITGNGPHNPFVNGTGTYDFTVPTGVTVSDVSFQFGTTPGGTISAPEPSSLLLLGFGLLGLALLTVRRSLTV
jgi:hypothetical protein